MSFPRPPEHLLRRDLAVMAEVLGERLPEDWLSQPPDEKAEESPLPAAARDTGGRDSEK